MQIRTFSGLMVDPFNLKPGDLTLLDISTSLSRQARYLGHTTEPYYVATHCILVAEDLASLHTGLGAVRLGLLHDAAEAYLHDIVSPIKHRPEFAFYREAEERALTVILERFDIDPSFWAYVHESDQAVGTRERLALMKGFTGTPPNSVRYHFPQWNSFRSAAEFLAKAQALGIHE